MVDLHGHEAGNGGYGQRKPTAQRGSSTRNQARYAVRAIRKAAETSPFQHRVFPRLTGFIWNRPENETTIQDVYAALFSDQSRNDLIVRDLVQTLSARRSPLVLTGRTDHLDYLAEQLRGICSHTFILR